MVYFSSAYIYIESCSDLRAKIAAIEAIQAALETSALTAATTGHISEYMLNDGQTIIKAIYRNVSEITRSINDLEKIKQRYIIKLNGGRMTRLMDEKNFRKRW